MNSFLAVGEKGLHEALRSQDYELINAYAGKYTDLLKKVLLCL